VDDVGLESAVDYLALDDVAWLGLLAQYGDCIVGCDECVEGVDLAKSVRLIGKMRRSECHYPFPRSGSRMCFFTKVLDLHASVGCCSDQSSIRCYSRVSHQ
jgi:hypothetical protein